ncbi:MAG: nicotinamide riboside transporter PnuC [Bacteroidota bacterium]
MNPFEVGGLIFGLLCVILLIRRNIWTWPCGIVYVLFSFIVFAQYRLYGDFIVHVVFLLLNIYGWIHWANGRGADQQDVRVSYSSSTQNLVHLAISLVGILVFAQVLSYLPSIIPELPPAALPYWDSTTSVLSITGVWLTTQKKIENWYYWLAVDVLSTGIYWYKGMFFYSVLYFVYIGLAISGYVAWRRSWLSNSATAQTY